MRIWMALFAAAVLALAGAACGGGSTSGEGEKNESPVVSQSPSAAASTPEALAAAIHKDFLALQGELATMVAGQPTAATLRPKVAELKERYIGKFVGYGRVRERMSGTDAKKVENEFSRLLFTPPTVDISALSTATARFTQTDPALSKEIASLNILTQYAFFDLLKKQEPAEAARLGIN